MDAIELQEKALKAQQDAYDRGEAYDPSSISVREEVVLPSGEKVFLDQEEQNIEEFKQETLEAGKTIQKIFKGEYEEQLDTVRVNQLSNGIDIDKMEPVDLQKLVIDSLKTNKDLTADEIKAIAKYDKKYTTTHSRVEDYNTTRKVAEQQVLSGNYQNLYEDLVSGTQRTNRRTGEKKTVNDIRIITPGGSVISTSDILQSNKVTNGETFKDLLNKPDGKLLQANFLLADELKSTSNNRVRSSQEKKRLTKRLKAQELLGLNNSEMEAYVEDYKKFNRQFALSYKDMTKMGNTIDKFNNVDKVDPNKLREIRVRQYANRGINEKSLNVITIKGGTKLAKYFDEFKDLGISATNKENIFMQENPRNPSKVDIYTREEVETESEKGESKKAYHTVLKGSVKKADLAKNPLISSNIDIMEKKAQFDYNIKTKKTSTEPKYFTENTDFKRKAFVEALGGNGNSSDLKEKSALITKSGVTEVLDRQMSRMAEAPKIEVASILKDRYLTDFSKFRVSYAGNDTIGSKISIKYQKEEGKLLELASFPLDKNKASTDNYHTLFSQYPNVILAEEMQKVLRMYAYGNNSMLNVENINKVLGQ